MAPPAGFATAWLRQLGLIVIALGLVLVVWRLGAPARAATSLAARPATVATMFGGALRPARSLRVAFGSPEGRALLVEGFTPTAEAIAPAGGRAQRGARGAASRTGSGPRRDGASVVLWARHGSKRKAAGLEVRVNETSAGELVSARSSRSVDSPFRAARSLRSAIASSSRASAHTAGSSRSLLLGSSPPRARCRWT